VIIGGHDFVQNLHRGRCELAVDVPSGLRLISLFAEPAGGI